MDMGSCNYYADYGDMVDDGFDAESDKVDIGFETESDEVVDDGFAARLCQRFALQLQ